MVDDQTTTSPDMAGDPGSHTDVATEDLPEVPSTSVEATPAGIEPDSAAAPVTASDVEDSSPAGALAAAFAAAQAAATAPPQTAPPAEPTEDVSPVQDEIVEEAAAVEETAAVAEPDTDDSAGESEEEVEEEEVPADTGPASPYDLPGDWYVIHSYSGYENKVKANLETRIHSMHMEGEIFDVVIPLEDVVEIKGGRKVTVPKKVFPGYILVRMYMSDDSWFAVRNTPGVTGFVGSGTKPTPLSRREVERILGVKKEEEEKAAPRFKPAWDVGETVRVVDGPFADFNGVIEEINLDQSRVRVLVNIFGRETPVELTFEQIVKL